MKKTLAILVAGTIFFAIGCKAQKLPIPQYPLSEESILSVFDELGIDSALELDISSGGPRTLYVMIDPKTSKHIAGITSVVRDHDRIVNIGFMQFYNENAYHGEDIEKAILLATKLFGDFRDEQSVLKLFLEEYPSTNTETREVTIIKEDRYRLKSRSTWQRKVEGKDVVIVLEQPYSDKYPESLLSISISTDRGVFIPKSK